MVQNLPAAGGVTDRQGDEFIRSEYMTAKNIFSFFSTFCTTFKFDLAIIGHHISKDNLLCLFLVIIIEPDYI
jgi:hypothetical protein